MAFCPQEHGVGCGEGGTAGLLGAHPGLAACSDHPQQRLVLAILLPGRTTHLHFNCLRATLKLRETKANSAHLLHSSAATLIIASSPFSTAVHFFFKLLYVYSF